MLDNCVDLWIKKDSWVVTYICVRGCVAEERGNEERNKKDKNAIVR